jgi:hypothetical protein
MSHRLERRSWKERAGDNDYGAFTLAMVRICKFCMEK